PNWEPSLIVCMVSSGVALSSHGELNFHTIGLLIQATAVAVPSCLAIIQSFLHGLNMVPLVSLHHYAPVGTAISALVHWGRDGQY
ncbi:hypothetical protein BDN67DRAFT_896166, partial [Paxillus ammoniavirescens]